MTLRPVMLTPMLLAGTTLASCGKQGDLERPAPLFGAQAKADYEARKAAEAQKKADKQADDADPHQDRAVEAPSAITEPNNSGSTGPQGAIPNPLSNP